MLLNCPKIIYPINTHCIDPEIIPLHGDGSRNYDRSEKNVDGEVIVYIHQLVGEDKKGIIICGYKSSPKGLFRCLKSSKIRRIPNSKRPEIELKLLKKLNEEPSFVNWWI